MLHHTSVYKVTNLEGTAIITYQELLKNLTTKTGGHCQGDSYSTIEGYVLIDDRKYCIYKHWSYDGPMGIYDEGRCNLLGEVKNEEWYPALDNKGKQRYDESGLWKLLDCKINFIFT